NFYGGMSMNLSEKIAIITGGNQGIGLATATALAAAGATVIIAARKEAAGQQAVTSIQAKYPGQAYFYKVDITDPAAVNKMMQAIQEKFDHIDILVNNAGICSLSLPFEDLSIESWDRVMDVNVKGLVHCIKAVIPLFKKQEKGKIINIASLAGEVGGIATSADYVASKAAVIGITKSLARYLGPYNINVNAVAPGFIATDMTAAMSIPTGSIPLRRSGQPDDVANGIVFLASDRADYITGTTLDINGGLYMK
ncbi:MAG: SDR family NAD(P)-dependent oxidoreductase, partial [Selenomonadaceae bacterium]